MRGQYVRVSTDVRRKDEGLRGGKMDESHKFHITDNPVKTHKTDNIYISKNLRLKRTSREFFPSLFLPKWLHTDCGF